MDEKIYWGAMIAFGAVSFVFFVGWWTYAANDNFKACLAAGGNAFGNGGCKVHYQLPASEE